MSGNEKVLIIGKENDRPLDTQELGDYGICAVSCGSVTIIAALNGPMETSSRRYLPMEAVKGRGYVDGVILEDYVKPTPATLTILLNSCLLPIND